MGVDPIESNPGLYSLVFENERVRVLEYRDTPGTTSVPHHHPDSVMVTLGAFERRLSSGDRTVEVTMPAGVARWLGEQSHSGVNTGSTETHVIFIELKEPASRASEGGAPLGPTGD